ncbi:type 1 glutamine amidotransferase [Apilactobacillus micheneri]|uniref:type 1 glutamine amidotransferase domain-containing protein n=1 Tax=Apilactobacillus micheneri TaxID=1899430 RepID=UPI00112E204E|nr:type 1 glutamine amidotransferase domain-containing protein [Apilactobacillus micheneri]TPR42979.1 type 1 glutamine amidotransferase [Apilactobacillus micheneri]TPR47311.1 type 1 glutamine amidotransferase [Apilactobacillus micheneri]
MSKIAAVVTSGYEDSELTSPKKALEDASHSVDIIEAKAGNEIHGEHGDVQKVDVSIDDADFDSYDALLLPGGGSPDALRVDARYVNFVKEFLMANKPVFAICHGPQFFIQTGLTNELKLTAYTTIRYDLFYAGAEVLNAPVVVDSKHKLVTSRTPDDLEDFNRESLQLLK